MRNVSALALAVALLWWSPVALADTTIGTSGGNKTVTEITIGTASGNKTVTEGWIGTASGNKQFYSNGYGGETFTFTSGSGFVTVPVGATTCTAKAYSGGGSGKSGGGGGHPPFYGGAGGARAKKTFAVVAGQTIDYSVGAGGVSATSHNGYPGGNTTINNWSGGSLSLLATGGAGGSSSSAPAVAGVATGGDDDVSGNVGQADEYDFEGETYIGYGDDGAGVDGYGNGSYGAVGGASSFAGGNGAAIFIFT